MAAKKPTITRVRIAREELEKMTKEDLQKCWNLQDQYVDLLEGKLNSNIEHTELMSLRESEEKLKQQQLDASRRENILVMRLTTKEHEVQEYAGQIQELKQAQIPTIAQLRSALLDPAVNLLFERMRKEMDSLKARLEETQNELNAWKFTPDSNTGKRLMAKCRLLYQENEELGKIIASGRVAKIEGDLALQKSFSEEMKKSQSELDEFLLELDEDVEGMQSTIYYLQQQLREAKEQISRLQKEKTDSTDSTNPFPVNNFENSENGKSPEPSFARDVDTPNLSLSHELNGLNPEPVIKNIKTEAPSPPPFDDHSETLFQNKEEKMDIAMDTGTSECIADVPREKASPKTPPLPIPENVKSVIVLNKDILNHDKLISNEERTNSPAPSTLIIKTNENNVVENNLGNSLDSEIQSKKSTNLTADEGRGGKKRTRPRTPIEPPEKDESNLPVRKRTRRREAELLQQTLEEKISPVEISTDAEFQAAHTLASWASKQERTENQIDVTSNSLGNGDLAKQTE